MSHGIGLTQGPVLRPQPQLPPPGAMHPPSAMPGDAELFSEVLKVGRSQRARGKSAGWRTAADARKLHCLLLYRTYARGLSILLKGRGQRIAFRYCSLSILQP